MASPVQTCPDLSIFTNDSICLCSTSTLRGPLPALEPHWNRTGTALETASGKGQKKKKKTEQEHRKEYNNQRGQVHVEQVTTEIRSQHFSFFIIVLATQFYPSSSYFFFFFSFFLSFFLSAENLCIWMEPGPTRSGRAGQNSLPFCHLLEHNDLFIGRNINVVCLYVFPVFLSLHFLPCNGIDKEQKRPVFYSILSILHDIWVFLDLV